MDVKKKLYPEQHALRLYYDAFKIAFTKSMKARTRPILAIGLYMPGSKEIILLRQGLNDSSNISIT
jgi:hypothetical protein